MKADLTVVKPKCVVCKAEDGSLRPPRLVKLTLCKKCSQFCCVDCLDKHPCNAEALILQQNTAGNN